MYIFQMLKTRIFNLCAYITKTVEDPKVFSHNLLCRSILQARTNFLQYIILNKQILPFKQVFTIQYCGIFDKIPHAVSLFSKIVIQGILPVKITMLTLKKVSTTSIHFHSFEPDLLSLPSSYTL